MLKRRKRKERTQETWEMLLTGCFCIPWRFLRLSLIMTLVDFRYDRNKLAITATGTPNWIEELEDDFEDMEEDIETYRCTCKWSEIRGEKTIWLEQRIVCVSCSANNRETWYCIPRLGHNEAVKGTKGSFLLRIKASSNAMDTLSSTFLVNGAKLFLFLSTLSDGKFNLWGLLRLSPFQCPLYNCYC